jgi:hypothetical protein
VFGACAALWLIWVVGFVAADLLGIGAGFQAFAQFGDTFGALNALFTALAFAAFWWTGWMQQQELRLQRQELKNQQEELASTREVFKRQTFETAFFNQLELFRTVSSSIKIGDLTGANAIEDVGGDLSEVVHDHRGYAPDAIRKALIDRYSDHWYRHHEAQLGPYFRTLYHIFKLIDRQDHMTEAEQVEFANIARAQLGADALVILSVNALTPMGAGFVPLIEKYGVLKHLPIDEAMLETFKPTVKASAIKGYDERKAS